MVKIGIIGGSGLDNPNILKDSEEITVVTEYGDPSSPLTFGKIGGVATVIIARHGRKHQFNPTEVNYRANIQALTDQNVTHILATTACGSLKEEIGRGDFVILDQFIDFTRHRINTFHSSFSDGMVHAAMAEPFDRELREILIRTSRKLDFPVHHSGTVVTIEGPRFSTKAESKMFRLWGGDVINMSTATEAALANEAGIHYAVVAMSTDYDCWKEDEAPVSMEEVLAVFEANADMVKRLLVESVSSFGD